MLPVDKPKGVKRLSFNRYKTLHHKLSPSTTGDWHHAMENKPVSGPRPHMMRVMLIQNVAVDQRFANGAPPAALPPQAYTPSHLLVFPFIPSFLVDHSLSRNTCTLPALPPSIPSQQPIISNISTMEHREGYYTGIQKQRQMSAKPYLPIFQIFRRDFVRRVHYQRSR